MFLNQQQVSTKIVTRNKQQEPLAMTGGRVLLNYCPNKKQGLSLRLVCQLAETKRSGVRQSPACGFDVLKAMWQQVLSRWVMEIAS